MQNCIIKLDTPVDVGLPHARDSLMRLTESGPVLSASRKAGISPSVRSGRTRMSGRRPAVVQRPHIRLQFTGQCSLWINSSLFSCIFCLVCSSASVVHPQMCSLASANRYYNLFDVCFPPGVQTVFACLSHAVTWPSLLVWKQWGRWGRSWGKTS